MSETGKKLGVLVGALLPTMKCQFTASELNTALLLLGGSKLLICQLQAALLGEDPSQ